MTHYCDNEFCEAEATKRVFVSVNKPGDENRRLCGACEEVFTWGVQHGYMVGKKDAEAKNRDQVQERDRIIKDLRRCLRRTHKTIRAAVRGVWPNTVAGWISVLAGIKQTLAETAPRKGNVKP